MDIKGLTGKAKTGKLSAPAKAPSLVQKLTGKLGTAKKKNEPPAVPDTTGQRKGEMSAFSGAANGQMPWEAPQAESVPSNRRMKAEVGRRNGGGGDGDLSLTATVPAQMSAPASEGVGKAIAAQTDRPGDSIRQMFATSCMAATVQASFAMRFPEDYRAFAENLWTTGVATFNGQLFKLDAATLAELKNAPGKSTTERLNMVVQAALMEFGNGDQRFDWKTSLSKGASGAAQDGLTMDQAANLAITLRANFGRAQGDGGGETEQERINQMMEDYNSLPAHHLPMIISVPSGTGGMRHAIMIVADPDGQKLIYDPRGSSKPLDERRLAEAIYGTKSGSSFGGGRTRKTGSGSGSV